MTPDGDWAPMPPHAHDHGAHDHHDHEHGEHGHGHDHEQEADDRIRVLHGASPLCHWSFGYEPVLQRLRLLYGDQIKVNVYTIPVYDSWEEHVAKYGLDAGGMAAWFEESDAAIGLPANLKAFDPPTRDCTPATRVVHAAELVKPGAGEKVMRRIHFALYMEGANFNDLGKLLAIAEACGAPRKAVEAAIADGRADEAIRADNGDMHALGLNFFELQVAQGKRRAVLEHGFDPADAEGAIAWLSGGKLRKQALPSVADYVAAHAPVTRWELERVFQLGSQEAEAAAAPAEKAGKVQRRVVHGHPCWVPPGK
jgi:putative protein-disulfide isomerase